MKDRCGLEIKQTHSRGQRRLRNDDDGIFGQGGGQMVLAPTKVDAGYEASFDVALDLT